MQGGLVSSLSRPGGNITGTTFLDPELAAKQLAPLKELLPTASRVAVLSNPKAFSEQTIAGMVKQTAEPRGVQISNCITVKCPLSMPSSAQSQMLQAGNPTLFQFPNPTFFENRKRLVDLAAQYRLSAMYNSREFVAVGGLIGYGANPLVLNRRAAFFVDKILKRAADLPVEQPTIFDSAINRTTAKMLGINIPQCLSPQPTRLID
jgi:putative tryptophan/tyrosine transport system substrate-binding protein